MDMPLIHRQVFDVAVYAGNTRSTAFGLSGKRFFYYSNRYQLLFSCSILSIFPQTFSATFLRYDFIVTFYNAHTVADCFTHELTDVRI